MRTIRDMQRETSTDAVSAFGAIRRMAISLTSQVLWQLAGFLQDGGTQETFMAEPFTGIGTFAQPPNGGAPEAVVVMVGRDGKTPVIVAVRDQKTRAAIVSALTGGGSALNADETVVHNSQAVVYVKSNGTIEARAANGAAQALAFNADLANVGGLLSAMYQAASAASGAPPAAAVAAIAALVTWGAANPSWVGSAGPPPVAPTTPVGTTIIKGQ
jgi:hypothetical protein